MQKSQGRFTIKGITSLAALVAFLLSLSIQASAQRNNSRGSSPAMDRSRESGVREHERQLQVLLNSKEPGPSGNPARLQAIIEQTMQDFERIQVVNRELVSTATANHRFDYRSLTEMAAEIKKRARRLKDNVSLPPPAEAEAREKRESEISQAEMKAALLMLSDRIVSFTTNPLFQTPNTIDVQLGAKASRDLESIIELSGQIKKSAERLGKSPKKSDN
jgi:hypothetical protein